MTQRRLGMEQWLALLGSMLSLLPLGCLQQTSVACTPPAPVLGDAWVTRQECWGLGDGFSTIIQIGMERPDSEFWVLEEPDGYYTATPSTPIGVGLHGRYLNDDVMALRSKALVQMNGFTFSCSPNPDDKSELCYFFGGLEYPVTTVYETTKMLSRNLVPPSEDFSGQFMLSFNPRRSARPLIELSAEGTEPGDDAPGYYNAIGSVMPLLIEGDCTSWQPIDSTVIGYSDDKIIMLYTAKGDFRKICDFLSTNLGVHHAVLMDGSYSAGMYLKDGSAIGHVGQDWGLARHIPYRIGLVTLEAVNRVTNSGFESPQLETAPSGTPTGFHSYGAEQTALAPWRGAMFLYNTPLYHEWVSGHRQAQKEPLPSRGAQIAAIRTRGDDTNHITQEFGVPDNRYCLLNFFHGYHKPNGCNEPESKLTVTAGPCGSAEPYTTAEYHSSPTHGWDSGLLHEVRLRLLTHGTGECMRISFTASKPRPEETTGNCEVLLDDVSVSCVQ